MNCVQPVNWKYCYRVDQWLIPDLVEGYEIWSGQKKIYQNEKDYLNEINSGSTSINDFDDSIGVR